MLTNPFPAPLAPPPPPRPQMNAQRRRMKIEEHKREVERLWAEKHVRGPRSRYCAKQG